MTNLRVITGGARRRERSPRSLAKAGLLLELAQAALIREQRLLEPEADGKITAALELVRKAAADLRAIESLPDQGPRQ
jgi:hypothetical protein